MPAPTWTTRLIDAPADDLLGRGDVAKLLGVSETTVGEMVKDGLLPAPLVVGKGGRVWDWRSVAYYRLRIEMAARLGPTALDAAE